MVVVARMWRLPDGTECLIAKGESAWRAYVTRSGVELRAELFSDGSAALVAARSWRVQYEAGANAA